MAIYTPTKLRNFRVCSKKGFMEFITKCHWNICKIIWM